ncbi:hypothetical protein ACHAXA_005326 [Cyclostephanos tholiformis]|uniref:Fungal lipase-type domain-containing protein n=1 Tax=Cyclostephanos tholiformis TaxID=382380 RepID=A0ABD3RAK2_9STRA
MVDMSNLIYVLAEVREMARSGALDDDGTGALSSMVLDLPSSLDDLAGALLGGGRGGGDVLGEKLDDGKHAAVMGALGGLLRRREETRAALSSSYDGGGGGGGFGWMMACCGAANIGGSTTGGAMVGPSIITDMGDARSNEELVYAVGVNPLMERITIIFRGSVTKSDFVTDSRIAFVRAPHPNKLNGLVAMDRYGGCDDVGLHQGFYEYLLGEKDGRSSKYDEISNIVRRLLREDPARANYKLYVTGHSLGGALATLFGYYASMSPHLPSPITVVSVASPRVGNIEFARSFVELESHGRIRHLRIANHGDPVTLNPTISARRALALSAKAVSPLGYLALLVTGNGEGGEEQVYYHTGIKLKLLRKACPESNRRCEITYSGASILAGAKKPADTDMDAEDFADMEQQRRR